MPAKTRNITLEGARIGFRNFQGRETPFNQKGSRNFVVFLSDEDATRLRDDGWNVKFPQDPAIEEEGYVAPAPFLPVALRFDVFPPKIVQISQNGRTILNEDLVDGLDWVEIINCDLTIRPYDWELPNGKSGTKAYLKTMFVTIEEDDLEAKYSKIDKS